MTSADDLFGIAQDDASKAVAAEQGAQVRVLQCLTCKKVETLPDYQGHPDDDHVLDYALIPHGGQTENPHFGALHRLPESQWSDPKIRKATMERMWEGTTGFTPSYYDVKNTLQEDASKCFTAHRRAVPCIDWHDSSKRIGAGTKKMREKVARELPRSSPIDAERLAKGQPVQYLCDFCLSGDTEIVTSTGLQRIDSLVGKPVDLLVPVGTRWGAGTASRGVFQQAEVRYFGEQTLWEIEMQRGPRTKRVVHATAEHRWFTREGEVNTATLSAGDHLLPIRATGPRDREKPVRFLMAQGVVYGDGAHGHHDKRPATLPVFNNGKDAALLGLFTGHVITSAEGHPVVRSLPREWKTLRPTLGVESRSGLLSWLAGYFAADGTVDKRGSASLASADRSALEYVRSLGAVCGVTVGEIRTKMRAGFPGRTPSAIHEVSIDPVHLPEWFWLIEQHRERVQDRVARPAVKRDWVVTSVRATDRVESVYCGVVDGVGAFALADDLLTGNCPVAASVEHAKRVARGLD
jgi:hypothetical protein